MTLLETTRMKAQHPHTNPVSGQVKWNACKSIWYSAHGILGGVGIIFFFEWSAFTVAGLLTALTLCCGHTVGLHRLLIHRSFDCPRWLERFLAYLGTLVGMGGPFGMIYQHDIRDWAQRHPLCHPFFIHSSKFWCDWFWNLHCNITLTNPPRFVIQPCQKSDPCLRFLQSTWMLQQLPIALLLYLIGGWSFVLLGVSGRIFLSLTGHWLVGYFAHNQGRLRWIQPTHAVQGFNLPYLGLLTMGECWHNNHHAFPESARLGHRHQCDPGWWFICILRYLHLAHHITLPSDLPCPPNTISKVTLDE